MKRNRLFYFAATAAGALAFSACHNDKANMQKNMVESIDVAYPMIDSVVLYNEYPGYISAQSQSDVVARVSGYVRKKFFTDGAWVKAGTPLFEIESTNYVDQLNKAEASLQTAIASKEYAQKEYDAMKKALESDAVSKMDVVQAESNLRQAEASIETAQASVQSARTMLGYCTIRAPFDGHVAAPSVIVGDYVGGENSPVTVTQIYDDSKLNVNFSIDSDRFLAMTSNEKKHKIDLQHVPVTFGDSILTTYYGTLDYQSPDVSRSTGTISLRLSLSNPDGELKSGMYANILLPYDVAPKAVVIKDASISTDQLGKYVYVVNDSNKVVYTPIKIGQLYQDSLRIVNSGLTASDRYVTRALLKVRDGMSVKPVVVNQPAK